MDLDDDFDLDLDFDDLSATAYVPTSHTEEEPDLSYHNGTASTYSDTTDGFHPLFRSSKKRKEQLREQLSRLERKVEILSKKLHDLNRAKVNLEEARETGDDIRTTTRSQQDGNEITSNESQNAILSWMQYRSRVFKRPEALSPGNNCSIESDGSDVSTGDSIENDDQVTDGATKGSDFTTHDDQETKHDPEDASFSAHRLADVDLEQLCPSLADRVFLWQTFQYNIDPIMKILHSPTASKVLLDTRGIRPNTPSNFALCFSVCYCAVASMQDDEVQAHFGTSRSQALLRYKAAFEQALACANFARDPDFTILQSLTLFLVLSRLHEDAKYCWSLLGVTIHIARGMQIHRDGSHFNLSVFDVELRRRLWWELCLIDFRTSEELGADPAILACSFDTELPANINDSDLDIDSESIPPPREERCDCTISLLRYEICFLLRQIYALGSHAASGDLKAALKEREQMLVRTYNQLEIKFLSFCTNKTHPLDIMTVVAARILLAKMGLMVYQPLLQAGQTSCEKLKADLFLSAIEVVELTNIIMSHDQFQPWSWQFKVHVQWNSIAVVLREVALRPWTSTSERAWQAANATLRLQRNPIDSIGSISAWKPIQVLLRVAGRHRSEELDRIRGEGLDTPTANDDERPSSLAAQVGSARELKWRLLDFRNRWHALYPAKSYKSPLSTPSTTTGVVGPFSQWLPFPEPLLQDLGLIGIAMVGSDDIWPSKF